MRQGASRSALRERRDDLNETPRCATLALMNSEILPDVIWEPCAGRGAIVRELRKNGHDVIATDLVAYPGADPGIMSKVDFLMERKPWKGAQCIVTNPPFKNADDIIRRGLSFGLPVIVLLRLMALEGAGRSDIIDRHLVRVWAGIERLPSMHRDGWTGPKREHSGAPFAWFVFLPKSRGDKPIELRRMSWRGGDDANA